MFVLVFSPITKLFLTSSSLFITNFYCTVHSVYIRLVVRIFAQERKAPEKIA